MGGNLHIALAVVFDLKCGIARTVYLAAKLQHSLYEDRGVLLVCAIGL
jgi:hypothetical protein